MSQLPVTSAPASPAYGRDTMSPGSRPDPGLLGFEHRFATVEGVRLHYVTGGNPEGEILVLLAGFPESWYAWRKVMARLAADFRLVAPDLPGQGDSDRPGDGYDTRALAISVHGLRSQLRGQSIFPGCP